MAAAFVGFGLFIIPYEVHAITAIALNGRHAVTHANAFGQISLRMKARHNRKKPNHQTGQFDDNECIYNFILDTYVRNLTAPPIQPLTTMGADDSMPFSQIHCAFEFINILSLDLPANHLYLISYAIRISLLLSLLAKFKATICWHHRIVCEVVDDPSASRTVRK